MNYQSTTGFSEETNSRKMRYLVLPAGLAGLVPLVYAKKSMSVRLFAIGWKVANHPGKDFATGKNDFKKYISIPYRGSKKALNTAR